MPRYNFDPTHSAADFSARHMMITTVRGGFKNVNGYVEYDPANPANSYVEATIDTNQITSTGLQQRDDHLKSAEFLDIENFPTITFKSTKVEPYGNGNNAKITGDLTIHGVTKSVVVDAELLGENKSPWGTTNIGFTGSTKINREDFGLTWNMALETGGWLVGKDITINLDVEAVLVTEAAAV
ncbi:MAG TPA: YceI family protein [Phototrophicaceae bacterium]|jgi:polyisoprenoid-binding protein YceI|nr:YceI family protein [Phototrophicaceae bacterium]